MAVGGGARVHAVAVEPRGLKVSRVGTVGELKVRGLGGETDLLRIGDELRLRAGMQLLERWHSGIAADILRGPTFGEQHPAELDGVKLAETAPGCASTVPVTTGTADGVTTEATQLETDGFAVWNCCPTGTAFTRGA